MVSFGLLVLGLVLLYYGAEFLVKGSSSLAFQLGVTPLLIGITIIAFGTSSPELTVSVGAALTGNSGIALGNVVGSNICNILLILGIAALIRPLEVKVQLVRLDVPVLIVCSVVLGLFLIDRTISRIEGGVLFAGICLYVFYNIREARKARLKVQEQVSEDAGIEIIVPSRSVLFAVSGLLLLLTGGYVFVEAAVKLATHFGVSKILIGLTIVAIGTSLPELATTVLASIKGAADIAIGNVVGSNIFNILAILGLVAIIQPIQDVEIDVWDITVMIGAAVCLLPVMRTGFQISRREGFVLLLLYAAYMTFLILSKGMGLL